MKRFLALLLCAILILALFPAAAFAASSGSCGKNLSWSLTDGTLTISGFGEMKDYSKDEPAPWSKKNIRSIELQNGITRIGSYAFRNCHDVWLGVSIPDGVTEIGAHAFDGCDSLSLMYIPDSVRSIGKNALRRCSQLTVYVEHGSYAAEYCAENVVSYCYEYNTDNDINYRPASAPGKSCPIHVLSDSVYLVALKDYDPQAYFRNIQYVQYDFLQEGNDGQCVFILPEPVEDCIDFYAKFAIMASDRFDYSDVTWSFLAYDAELDGWYLGDAFPYVDGQYNYAHVVFGSPSCVDAVTVLPYYAPNGFGAYDIGFEIKSLCVCFKTLAAAESFVDMLLSL